MNGKQRMTRALMVTLAIWTRVLPWKQGCSAVSLRLGTVATAVEEAVAYGLANRDLDGLTHIGIDEISRKRGHVYVTNVYDLRSKRLVWSGEERSKETLEAFFEFLGPEKTAALDGICCDMWQPYIDVIKEQAPQAVLVFDKFHIVRHLMEAVDQVRRDEVREKGRRTRPLMYKTRFIWLKNPWNLTEGQAFRLGELGTAQSQDQPRLSAQRVVSVISGTTPTLAGPGGTSSDGFGRATHSRLEPMRDFAWMVRRHEEDILNYFRMPIDNGTVEGLNNKAKLVIHKSLWIPNRKELHP